jgi:hypothetical protein
MIFPSDEDAALPLDPGKEAFDQPAPQEASQAAPVCHARGSTAKHIKNSLSQDAGQVPEASSESTCCWPPSASTGR